jgi:hypothetical protein
MRTASVIARQKASNGDKSTPMPALPRACRVRKKTCDFLRWISLIV